MARPKKNATVTEEVKNVPAEEKKTVRRGRPKKNAEPVAEETVEVKEEASAEAEVKQPAKRGRKKKTEAAVEEKKAEAKEPAKRGRKKKAEAAEKEITTIVQFRGNQIEGKEMIAKVEEAWKAEGNKAEIETITMYVKPEDGKIYYVVNGLSGSVDLF